MDLPEGWIAHDGLGCPVPLETRPAFMMRDGKTCEAVVFFGYSLSRRHNCGDGDIIAYKPEPTP